MKRVPGPVADVYDAMGSEPEVPPHADIVTAEMVVAGANAHHGIEGGTAGGAIACYKAMRAARPKCASQPAAAAHAVMVPVDMLKQMLRIPTQPFPDPGAHSWEAYARAVHTAYCQLRFKVLDALELPAAPVSPPEQVWRDAIEAAAKVCEQLSVPIEIDDLRKMTKGDMAAWACRECAAAIRSLPPPPAQEGK